LISIQEVDQRKVTKTAWRMARNRGENLIVTRLSSAGDDIASAYLVPPGLGKHKVVRTLAFARSVQTNYRSRPLVKQVGPEIVCAPAVGVKSVVW
jgi:hypothetical protein